MAIDEADEDLEDKEADLRVLHEGCGEQPVQEGAGKRRQHVTALEAHGDLEASEEKGDKVTGGFKHTKAEGMQAEKTKRSLSSS